MGEGSSSILPGICATPARGRRKCEGRGPDGRRLGLWCRDFAFEAQVVAELGILTLTSGEPLARGPFRCGCKG